MYFILYKIYMNEKDFINFWHKKIKINSLLKLIDYHNNEVILNIIYPGEVNTNFGPDVQNVKIKINNKILSGDIEFHNIDINWFKHNHHLDKKYDNVILHLVNFNNSKIRIVNSKGKRIKTFIIKNRVFLKNKNNSSINQRLPCFYLIQRKANNYEKIKNILIHMGINNLKKKILYILKFYKYYKNNYSEMDIFNQLLFVFIFRGLGYYHNRFHFQRKIILINYNENLEILYHYLSGCSFKKYGRPKNFPLKRINQFINLIKNCKHKLFDSIYCHFIFSSDFNDFTIKIAVLFNMHLNKNKISLERVKIITYNIIMPILYIYLTQYKHKIGKDKVINFLLNQDNFEQNKVLNIINNKLKLSLKVYAKKEIFVQGIYYLYNTFCKKKNCSNCTLYKKLN